VSTETELDMLGKLASEILSLERLAALAGDPAGRIVIEQLAGHFRWVMDDLSAGPGALSGDLPWWKIWRPPPAEPL